MQLRKELTIFFNLIYFLILRTELDPVKLKGNIERTQYKQKSPKKRQAHVKYDQKDTS